MESSILMDKLFSLFVSSSSDGIEAVIEFLSFVFFIVFLCFLFIGLFYLFKLDFAQRSCVKMYAKPDNIQRIGNISIIDLSFNYLNNERIYHSLDVDYHPFYFDGTGRDFLKEFTSKYTISFQIKDRKQGYSKDDMLWEILWNRGKRKHYLPLILSDKYRRNFIISGVFWDLSLSAEYYWSYCSMEPS